MTSALTIPVRTGSFIEPHANRIVHAQSLVLPPVLQAYLAPTKYRSNERRQDFKLKIGKFGVKGLVADEIPFHIITNFKIN